MNGACCGCAAEPGESIYLVACGSEYYRPGAGNSGADWQKADVWVADMPVCHRCILTICERYLGAELKSSKRDLVRSLCALAAVALLLLVAETGIFKGLGSLNLFVAIFFTVVFLFGVFGLPYYSYRSIRMFAQRASSRSGSPLKGDALLAAIQFEAARLLSAGQLKPAQRGGPPVSSLPEGHLSRETVLVAAADRAALAAKTPDAWRSWLQRRMPPLPNNS
jgi:hypothetical protein